MKKFEEWYKQFAGEFPTLTDPIQREACRQAWDAATAGGDRGADEGVEQLRRAASLDPHDPADHLGYVHENTGVRRLLIAVVLAWPPDTFCHRSLRSNAPQFPPR